MQPKVRGTQMRDGTISRSMGAARRGLWPSAPMEWPATTVRQACVSTDLNQHNTITTPASRLSNSVVKARHTSICSYRRWVPSFLPASTPAQNQKRRQMPGAGEAGGVQTGGHPRFLHWRPRDASLDDAMMTMAGRHHRCASVAHK